MPYDNNLSQVLLLQYWLHVRILLRNYNFVNTYTHYVCSTMLITHYVCSTMLIYFYLCTRCGVLCTNSVNNLINNDILPLVSMIKGDPKRLSCKWVHICTRIHVIPKNRCGLIWIYLLILKTIIKYISIPIRLYKTLTKNVVG